MCSEGQFNVKIIAVGLNYEYAGTFRVLFKTTIATQQFRTINLLPPCLRCTSAMTADTTARSSSRAEQVREGYAGARSNIIRHIDMNCFVRYVRSITGCTFMAIVARYLMVRKHVAIGLW